MHSHSFDADDMHSHSFDAEDMRSHSFDAEDMHSHSFDAVAVILLMQRTCTVNLLMQRTCTVILKYILKKYGIPNVRFDYLIGKSSNIFVYCDLIKAQTPLAYSINFTLCYSIDKQQWGEGSFNLELPDKPLTNIELYTFWWCIYPRYATKASKV